MTFAIFSLQSQKHFAIQRSGLRHCVNSDAALTKSPLWEARWLLLRLNALALKRNTSALSNSPKQLERSLLMPRCTFHPITTSSKYALMTKRLSSLMSSLASRCLLIWQIGQQEISTLYNDGDLSLADSLALKLKPAISGGHFSWSSNGNIRENSF